MSIIYQIHSVFGERVLPLLIIIAAIWFTVAWKPGVANPAARFFPILVDIQFALGLIYWIYGIVAGGSLGVLHLAYGVEAQWPVLSARALVGTGCAARAARHGAPGNGGRTQCVILHCFTRHSLERRKFCISPMNAV